MNGPHQDQPLETAGPPPEDAGAAVVMVHGRGATARSILGMAREFADDVAALAPQASGNTWYPNSFLAPVEQNEPHLSSALRAVEDAIETATDAGIPAERVLVLGFSQGACLASETLARSAREYGGLAALSGGLIGDEVQRERYEGDFAGMGAFFGCSDVDPHIPAERVHESAAVYGDLDADVTTRLYGGMGHGVNEDELEYVRGMVAALVE